MNNNFIIIGVNSIDESLNFYENVLDFKIEKRLNPNTNTDIVFIKKDNLKIELIKRDDMPPVDNSNSSISIAFSNDNLENRIKILSDKNIDYLQDSLGNGMKFLRFEDPTGVGVVIYE